MNRAYAAARQSRKYCFRSVEVDCRKRTDLETVAALTGDTVAADGGATHSHQRDMRWGGPALEEGGPCGGEAGAVEGLYRRQKVRCDRFEAYRRCRGWPRGDTAAEADGAICR